MVVVFSRLLNLNNLTLQQNKQYYNVWQCFSLKSCQAELVEAGMIS
jgi:hypothetical protein